MSLPELKTKSIKVDGLDDELIITELSAAAYVAMLDARAAGRSEVEVCAIIAKHCVPAWREHSVEEIMASALAGTLADIMLAVMDMVRGDSGNSETGQLASSF